MNPFDSLLNEVVKTAVVLFVREQITMYNIISLICIDNEPIHLL